jgi:CRISPR system Cascade subunit CasB
MKKATTIVPKQKTQDLLWKVIGNLANRLDPERIGSGSLAELRRMNDATPPPAFWRLLLEIVPESLRPESRERAWMLIIGGMARIAHKDFRIGQALAKTEYAEPRLVRLLRASGDNLATELRAACSWLDNKGYGVDWVQLAWFIFERIRDNPSFDNNKNSRNIARDYFGVLSRADAETPISEAKS